MFYSCAFIGFIVYDMMISDDMIYDTIRYDMIYDI
jgi:hypothetical protein